MRETGAIPAVLLVTAVSRMTTPVNGLVEIGIWVILLTLIVAPPLTPSVARKLGVAERLDEDLPNPRHEPVPELTTV